jgi:diaminohydroxyphosphoribosylaminopyrimidine deaminase / 5-amino-6-(5-phosphoribosylamino)uracil reductase
MHKVVKMKQAINPGHDETFMRKAVEKGYTQLGSVPPNPSVGALVVLHEQIIGEGVTQQPPGNHAEIEALSGCDARGATLYTTLEPCVHHNRTPPCVDIIIKSGVKRVVVGVTDPNPKVNGKGITALQQAGIDVTVGVHRKEAVKLHEAFFHWITTKKPFVIIKAAMTMDGSLTWGDGLRKRISSEESLVAVHVLRRQVDAILVGVNTIIKDNPKLTTRRVEGENPVRVILDTKLRIPLDADVLKQDGTTVIFCTRFADDEKKKKLDKLCTVVELPDRFGLVDVDAMLGELGKRGITSLMVEGGAKVHASFLNAGCVHKGVFFVTDNQIKGSGFFPLLKKKMELNHITVHKTGTDFMVEGYLTTKRGAKL